MLIGGLASTAPALADGPGAMRPEAAAAVAIMDSNRDGSISKAEFARHNAVPGRFAKLDTDADGSLDQQEQAAVTIGPRILR